MSNQLGELVRTQRRALGLNQQQLADQVGVTKSYIGAIEVGKAVEPSRSVTAKLAAALNIHVGAIERAIKATHRINEATERYLTNGPHSAQELWLAVLEAHGGDVAAALRYLDDAQAEGFKSL